ncbi:MAG: ribosome recycling factor [Candidatus Magasanikbacteria bacterium RIFCSPHIGHO2_01_FULL_41_23]|uniref:Ribosome-recycling factor n=1 Tax=Candidatus Magasanikbacteria bacterium RIFCSPLOWO2_01_FULL_40_15 TaxID=1798686 RepID=A0A1F6N2F2_9BACT|nr:MAG: ribosome recycling factor [Candidatus Magasanikbacteria bacterium RIFCSPHIGHO2_01_FULL_41_23]OGH66908.1 MAG: ribosome recycling factor [Candidatus Magasanikbacteria bacterium RIFCSPHIGHO2_02_FULL_41_35]OGH74892.1 MAG: ribosome recycling factor [Candidatus Magasanikbacteria bacterium RIFCSPHIGHO2_12_FULL_41_16]OGH78165.1 MAG: ribosome recycling factor [Candidatus Magasanikbacteria bacterium RIFCSPLOWO2_01_FULL_40_15]
MNIVQTNKQTFDETIEFLKHDITSLRTGRATPALVEDIVVEAYGTRQALKGVASIMVLDAKTLAIEPWDKSLMQAVETGIRNSSLGIGPVNDGKVIRLPLPALTTERRGELIKVLHQKLEATRISLRKIREDVRDEIDQAEKNNEFSEDEKFSLQEALEKMIKEYNEKVREIGEDKEKEIITI